MHLYVCTCVRAEGVCVGVPAGGQRDPHQCLVAEKLSVQL